ncbi:Serine/threonine-protein kinase RIO1 [Zea mays]|uniref:non-specific serine/threonine protein kinase n=1 Tax=Zea mays TaxID=4577 RepID=A0A3L6FX59_MAIZE|nr:Serine/threonine-protein kinase RIO1 [Zea mays]
MCVHNIIYLQLVFILLLDFIVCIVFSFLILLTAPFQIITTMRTLYQTCKLVHGDLSEYNILYFEGHLYIIDVSQSVDLDHPSALDFLKEDCLHVSDFFKKRGVPVMTVTDLFNFVIDQSISDEGVDDYLEKAQQKILENGGAVPNDDEITPTVMVQVGLREAM